MESRENWMKKMDSGRKKYTRYHLNILIFLKLMIYVTPIFFNVSPHRAICIVVISHSTPLLYKLNIIENGVWFGCDVAIVNRYAYLVMCKLWRMRYKINNICNLPISPWMYVSNPFLPFVNILKAYNINSLLTFVIN